MSRLSEILGVKEGQEFECVGMASVYKVEGEFIYYKINNSSKWNTLTGTGVYWMIANPENIHPIFQLTEQQITAIKGRIAEGTPWAVRYKDSHIVEFYKSEHYKPDDLLTGNVCNCDLYDFITFENSPVYLPELVEGSEK